MRQKIVIAILAFAVVVLAGATTYFAITKSTNQPSPTPDVVQQSVPTPIVQPSQPAASQQPAVQNIDQNTITEQDMKNLKIVLEKKYPSYVSSAEPNSTIKVFAKNGRYIRAMVQSESKELFSYPSFYAYKANDGWKIIFSGQDIPECSAANEYNFPNDIITECFDGNRTVQR